jgi:hypothetical protein
MMDPEDCPDDCRSEPPFRLVLIVATIGLLLFLAAVAISAQPAAEIVFPVPRTDYNPRIQYGGYKMVLAGPRSFLIVDALTGQAFNFQVAQYGGDPPGVYQWNRGDSYEFVTPNWGMSDRWIVTGSWNWGNWTRGGAGLRGPVVIDIAGPLPVYHGEIAVPDADALDKTGVGFYTIVENTVWMPLARPGACLIADLLTLEVQPHVAPCPGIVPQAGIAGRLYRYLDHENPRRIVQEGAWITPAAQPTAPTAPPSTFTPTSRPQAPATPRPCSPPIRDHFGNLVDCQGNPWSTTTSPPSSQPTHPWVPRPTATPDASSSVTPSDPSPSRTSPPTSETPAGTVPDTITTPPSGSSTPSAGEPTAATGPTVTPRGKRDSSRSGNRNILVGIGVFVLGGAGYAIWRLLKNRRDAQ